MKEISAQEANDLLQTDPSVAYLDVRSTPEFRAGRPKGALHAALMEKSPLLGRMAPNPEFLSQVAKILKPSQKIICGCQMGARSARAAQMLEAAGYLDVTNMRGGFGGARDPQSGEILEAGWTQLGLPVDQG